MHNYRKYSDIELAALLSKGDDAAFTEIYERYNGLLYIFAYKKLDNEDEAKDVVQEIFINLWNKRGSFVLRSSLSAYLYKSVYNKALNVFVHKKYEEKYISSFNTYLKDQVTESDKVFDEKELAGIIEAAIAMLPPKMREVFELSRKELLSHKEIAARLGISELTVRTQVKKALRILRLRLGLLIYLISLLDK